MSIFGGAKESIKVLGSNITDTMNGVTQKEPKPVVTLKELKDQISLSKLEYNQYNAYWNQKITYVDAYKKQANVIDNCAYGVGTFYNNVINDDIIFTMVNNVSNEVLEDIEFKIQIDEKTVTSKNIIDSMATTSKIALNKMTFKQTFEYLYMYEKVGVKIDIVNGQYIVVPLKPYEYSIDQYGTVEIITGFNGFEPIIEKRASNGEFSSIDGALTESKYFYELTFNSRLYNKLELILDYQLISATITKEVELNKTKIFMDRKMFRGKFINKEVMSLIDVPKSISADKTESIASYFNVVGSSNNLYALGDAMEGKSKKLVNGFRLSRKTLGLSENADFASSLPYENELTAKTINEYREQIGVMLTYLLSDLLKRNDIIIDLGKYKLTSKEAILDQNIKATQSQSESVNKKVANLLDKSKDDMEVIAETIKIKIENNITMTLEEEILAGELGLMPHLVDPNSFEV